MVPFEWLPCFCSSFFLLHDAICTVAAMFYSTAVVVVLSVCHSNVYVEQQTHYYNGYLLANLLYTGCAKKLPNFKAL